MKKILIAIPTARYIEPETFQSIFYLDKPDGYQVDFQTFYGYRIDQVRNLIADWVVRGYDYLFAVDADMILPRDTLTKFVAHNKPLVSGVYRQRLPDQHIELYDKHQRRMTIDQIQGNQLIEIGGCGFGCVLIKKELFTSIGYPQFEYRVALDHANTVSEDTDFCKKAMDRGYSLWCDPTVVCDHIGSTIYRVERPTVTSAPATSVMSDTAKRLLELHDQSLLPQDHVEFLHLLKKMENDPKVIYDIGACVLHWTNKAKEVWPDSKFILFEAMDEVEFLYKGYDHHLGVLSDVDNKKITFNQNLEHPGGNSYYQENPELSPMATELWTEDNKVHKIARTLDSVVAEKGFPLPDLIKMDVQGAELDILKGATNVLSNATLVILELQHMDYNIGAPKCQQVIDYMYEQGFMVYAEGFSKSALGVDSDWCFYRVKNV